ncbi:sensor histidine kinase [Dyella koreensis]|uniref:Histidine kinase/HSP90-like ATPase domain-containing protein n=1 Tax=Dyella koreensis TaxID=311235 RepID=A0ABW8K7Z1_9GAMM
MTLLGALALMISIPPVAAQSARLVTDQDASQMVHTAFRVIDGAPSDIQMIAVGPDGFMWIATSRGLTRFDGLHFDHEPVLGFPLQSVYDVFVDRDNSVWAGLLYGGMVRVREGKITLMKGDGFPPGTPFAMRQRNDGTLWEVTSKGVAHFDGSRWVPLPPNMGYTPVRPLRATLTPDQTLWINDNNHIYTLAAGARTFGHATEDDMWRAKNEMPADRQWKPAHQGGQGIRDRAGTNWSVMDSGIDRYHWQAGEPAPRIEHLGLAEGLSSEDIRGIAQDNDGNVWVWSSRGLDRFRHSRLTRVPIEGERAAPAMQADARDGIWVSSFQDPLWHVTGKGVQAVPGNGVVAFALSPDGKLWSVSQHGLQSDRGDEHERIPLPDEITRLNYQSLAVGPDGTAWLSVARWGLYRYRDGQWQRLTDQTTPEPTRMVFDARGRLWSVFDDRITVTEGEWTTSYTAADGLDVGPVISIDAAGPAVWVGGIKGVQLLNHGRFAGLVTSKGDALEGVSGLLITPSGELWANTLRGVARIGADDVARTMLEPTHVNRVQWFDHSDGISGAPQQRRPVPTLVQSRDGRIWASTNEGVFTIDPASFKPDARKLRPLVTHVSADGTSFDIRADIVLPKLAHTLQIDYTAPDLSAPERVRFRYRLDGIDKDWQEAGDRRAAFYTSLPPGSYVFHLMAANEDGVWGDDVVAIGFRLPPAWYQSIFFKLACGALVIALAMAAFYLRERRLARLRQVRRAERERIARDLHDTLLQGTQGLIYHVESALKQTRETNVRIMLIDAIERAQDTLIEGRERVNVLRADDSAPVDLVELLRVSAQTIMRGHHIRFDLATEGTPRLVHAPVAAELATIFQEALSNALLHAHARAIDARIVFQRRRLTIALKDDGRGIADKVLNNGGREGHWGIRGMHERAELFQGRVIISPGTDRGVVVTIHAPGKVAYAQ